MTVPAGSSSGGKSSGADIASLGAAELERRRQQRGSGEGAPAASAAPAGATPRARPRTPTERFAAQLQVSPRKDESGEYIRLIRDGYADRVEAMIREAGRDIEVGKKTDRYSKAAKDIVSEFETKAKEFTSKVELLKRVEERIGNLRKLVSEEADADEIQKVLGHDRPTSEKVARLLQDTRQFRDELINLALFIFEQRDRLDEQVRSEAKREEQLRLRITELSSNLSSKERVDLEVQLERSLRGVKHEPRLEILEKIEKKLTEDSPEGKELRKQQLLEEARSHLQSGHPEAALPLLEQAHEIVITSEEVLFELGKTYQILERYDAAVGAFNKLLKGGDAVEILVPLAQCLEALGQTAQALRTYERALALRPDDLGIRIAECVLLSHTGRFDEAVRRLTDLSARHPDSSETVLALARAYASQGMFPKARSILVTLTQQQPDCLDAWTELADLCWRSNDFDGAESASHKVLTLDPNSFQAHIRLGDLARMSGDFRSADEHYRTAETQNPDDFSVLLGLGAVLREKGQAEDAVRNLERAVAMNPNDAEAFHELGMAYLSKGDALAAGKAIQRAVSLNSTA